ncbi:MAG: ornithine cyclodeaminase family protein [Longimicrobiales bacterium]
MMRWQASGPNSELLLLDQADVARCLDMPRCVAGVEEAFHALGAGAVAGPGVLSVHVSGGAYHIKAGAWGDTFVAKVNANFPDNPRVGLPTIQGLATLFETETGRPLAILDSAELTARRTGAATGVAVKHLAVAGPLTVTLCGCGRQAVCQLEAVAAVRPLVRAYLCDVNAASARRLADEVADRMNAEVVPVAELRDCTRRSQVIITCTTASHAFVGSDAVTAGALIAAVGADNPHKSEIAAELMARSRVITDLTNQCAELGDLHHALAAGVMTRNDVYAELGEVVAGKRVGRGTERDVIVFDSTGVALQDVVAARLVYNAALRD